jgi:hypothetical protein
MERVQWGAVLEAAVGSVGEAVAQAVEAHATAEPLPPERPLERQGLAKSILYAIGLVAVANLVVILFSLVTRWWGTFGRGWPFELILVGLGLCLIMEATASVWLTIPTLILLGNGFLLAFYAVTGAWRLWLILWPLEPLLIVGAVLFAMWLSGQGERGRQIARHLGRSLKRPAAVALPIVILLGALFGS